MYIAPDSVWCAYCGTKSYTRDKLTTDVRYVIGELQETLARIDLKDKKSYPGTLRTITTLIREIGPLFYDALAALMLNRGNKRLLKSRIATVLFLLYEEFKGQDVKIDVGPYRSAPAPESDRAKHLKRLNAALQRRLSVVCGEPAGSEIHLLCNLSSHQQVAPYDRLLLLDYLCYLCVFLHEDKDPYTEEMFPLVSNLSPDGLVELIRTAAYFKVDKLHPGLRQLFEESTEVPLKKEIARYMARVGALDERSIEDVVSSIHQDLAGQEVEVVMGHLSFVLGLNTDRLKKRAHARPVLLAIKSYGSRRQKEWASRKYRKAILL